MKGEGRGKNLFFWFLGISLLLGLVFFRIYFWRIVGIILEF